MGSRRLPLTVVLVSLLAIPATAQWFNYPTPGTPRLADGSRTSRRRHRERPTASPISRGSGVAPGRCTASTSPRISARRRTALGRGAVPAAAAGLAQGQPARALPAGQRPVHNFFNLMRLVQTPALPCCSTSRRTARIARSTPTAGQLPIDPNPAWLGYSIGRWEGDTLVITTAGFNDRAWLDSAGHPQTESLRLTERLRRRDFGHMDSR